MAEITKEAIRNLEIRICKMNMVFTRGYLKDLEVAKKERQELEELKNSKSDEFRCVILTGDANAEVDLDCMKACAEIIEYLSGADPVVESWQYAGIMAMMDKANEECSVDYSMPQAISDILGIRFLKK